jgi:hypothetical protein
MLAFNGAPRPCTSSLIAPKDDVAAGTGNVVARVKERRGRFSLRTKYAEAAVSSENSRNNRRKQVKELSTQGIKGSLRAPATIAGTIRETSLQLCEIQQFSSVSIRRGTVLATSGFHSWVTEIMTGSACAETVEHRVNSRLSKVIE